ncbi:unnamed protein product [Pseudo-nitzschia multistriata]|uniref:CHAT domain-containing protein n=1 Tax=Pseudo-nitzschia multistriata TaxID=183589 RepID=A0A448ZPA5_9STRA|nr:unnamed protein product [Pseudo-nitzschia multistriata]
MRDMSFRDVNRRTEVSKGVFLHGRELEEFCQQRGLCPLCAKTKVKRKKGVFGPKKWEPITALRNGVVVATESSSGNKGKGSKESKQKKKKNGFSKRGGRKSTSVEEPATIESNINIDVDIDEGDYLVYKGFCLREGCFTLEHARRLVESAGKIGWPMEKQARRNTHIGSFTTGKKEDPRPRSLSDGFRGVDGVKGILANKPLSAKSKSSSGSKHKSRSVGSPGASSVSTDSDNDNAETKVSSADRTIFPPPQDRIKFLSEQVSLEGAPDAFYRSKNNSVKSHNFYNGSDDGEDLGEESMGSGGKPRKTKRDIIDKTIRVLRGEFWPIGGSVIRTVDLTGVSLNYSEVTALAESLEASRNHTPVHLSSLILRNCNIDNDRLGILGTAFYEALWNPSVTPTASNGTSSASFVRNYVMRLKTLDLAENKIGNAGMDALCPYLEASCCGLEVLDLSRNHIETLGGVTIFDALRRNPHTKIETIDLSHNLLRKLDAENENDEDDSFFSSSTGFFGPSFGIHGFLAKNRTLRDLNLSGNRMRNRGIEALFGGLCIAGPHARLTSVSLGFNRIGDAGAQAIASCLATNRSLRSIELNDNNIHNDGGRALLWAMGNNTTLKEISGLWSNNIDRRFIIVSIRRLLLSASDGDENDNDDRRVNNDEDLTKYWEGQMNVESGYEEQEEEQEQGDNQIQNSYHCDVIIENSGRGDRSYEVTTGEEDIESKCVSSHSRNSRSVDMEENVSDLSEDKDDDEQDRVKKNGKNDELSSYEMLLAEDSNENDIMTADGMTETNQEMSVNTSFDRMIILNSAPLVYFDEETGLHKSIPLHDSGYEIEIIRKAVAVAMTKGSKIEVRDEIATPDQFEASISLGDSPLIHFSCHGREDALALENGLGLLEKFPLRNLEELVSNNTNGPLKVVFVSSCHAHTIGQALIEAGVPHVVCCQRDAQFRDAVAMEFVKCFYRNAAKQMALNEAFETAVEDVLSSELSKNLRNVAKRFSLLSSSLFFEPSAPIFFQQAAVIEDDNHDADQQQILKVPPLPDRFVGREIDMFAILESMQSNSCVEISGCEGCGKDSVVTAVVDYAMKRSEAFSIDQAYWIPTPAQVEVEPDSVYEDFSLCCGLIRNSSEDIWDTTNEELLDCLERLEIELEEASVVVVIDSRSFNTEVSQVSLQKLVLFIQTHAYAAKVLWISTERDDEGIEKSHIELGALDFRSTALLFGENCDYISGNKGIQARSADEFAELVDPPFELKANTNVPSLGVSQRMKEVYHRMGNGFPSQVIAVAEWMSRTDFTEVLKIASKPELVVKSLNELERELVRWTLYAEEAVRAKNYKRAVDLRAVVSDLEAMRRGYSSLADLKEMEQTMKSDLANAISNRQYDVANNLKKDLLKLKKKIMMERRVPSTRLLQTQAVFDLKAQVDSIIAETKSYDGAELLDEFSQEETSSSFEVNCDGRTCTFRVCGVATVRTDRKNDIGKNHPKPTRGIVCWSNEACDLDDPRSSFLLLDDVDGEKFRARAELLPVVNETRYGAVRCVIGKSVVVGTTSDCCAGEGPSVGGAAVILAVGPFLDAPVDSTASSSSSSSSPPPPPIDAMLEKDRYFLHFARVSIRSCYRSCVAKAQQADLEVLTVRPLGTVGKSGQIYEDLLRIGVQTLVEEAKFSSLLEVRLVGSNPRETAKLVGILQEMGYSSSEPKNGRADGLTQERLS